MSNTWSVFVTIRIWFNGFFGFQTFKLGDRISRNDKLARYYSLSVVVVIVLTETTHMYCATGIYGNIDEIPQITLLMLSGTTAITAVLAILYDSCIYANEKNKQFNNFQIIYNTFSEETFNQSTVLGHTSVAFVIIFTLKGIHTVLALRSFAWNMFTIYIICRTFILTLMILQIVTEICTCKFYVKCIQNAMTSTYSQQPRDQIGIDFKTTSFSLAGSNLEEEIIVPKEKRISIIKEHIRIYALTIDTLKIISKRCKYAVSIN